MPMKQTSITAVLREIDSLIKQIQAAQVVKESDQRRRTEALKALESAGEILKRFCAAPSNNESYEEFQFTTRG